jgi:hypothetical protein
MAATMMKAKILEELSTLQLLTMREKFITTLEASEYLLLWMCEELENLWHWMGAMHTLRDATTIDNHNVVA